MSTWRDSLELYTRPRLVAVLLMGFSSGLPLPLTFGTLSFWFAESGVSRTAIGILSLVGAAYSFKFLWAPLVDRLPLGPLRSEEHTSELQSLRHLVCRLLL